VGRAEKAASVLRVGDHAKLGIRQRRWLVGKKMCAVMVAQNTAMQIREDLLLRNEGIQVMRPQASYVADPF
jgi:hypothetical protein